MSVRLSNKVYVEDTEGDEFSIEERDGYEGQWRLDTNPSCYYLSDDDVLEFAKALYDLVGEGE